MKITKSQLKQIIKEVITLLDEAKKYQYIRSDPPMTREEVHAVMRRLGLDPKRPPVWYKQTSSKFPDGVPINHTLRKEYRAWKEARKCLRDPDHPDCPQPPPDPPEPGLEDPRQSYDPEYHQAYADPHEDPAGGRIVIPRKVVQTLYNNFMNALDRHEETWDNWTNFDKTPAWKKFNNLLRGAEKGCVDGADGQTCGDGQVPWDGYDFLQGQGHKVLRLLGRRGGTDVHRGSRWGDTEPGDPKFEEAGQFIRALLLNRRHIVQPGGGEYGAGVRSMPSSAAEYEALRENKITNRIIKKLVTEELKLWG